MGGKKHKKKIYTTSKVISHKHITAPLASLKFYGVDANDKITVIKKFCPSSECGNGVCMADHIDRYYCGKCHLTISKL
jgi:ubiquitin-small subunit ribosomal protein S27Ae